MVGGEKKDDENERIATLQARIEELELENRKLRADQEQKQNVVDPEKSSVVAMVSSLSPEHIERYSRQLLLSGGFGVDGQLNILNSSVLVVGAGGIGSTLIPYLAGAGVGKLGIVDHDFVDVSNLHRQIIHQSGDAGMGKAVSAQRYVQNLNPTVSVSVFPQALDHDNVEDIMKGYDCVVDCTDNPFTRYLINDACVLMRKPLVSASAVGVEGQVTVYNFKGGPCYRCLYPSPNLSTAANCQTCSDAGVWGPVPGLMGLLQATQVLLVLARQGTGTILNRHLLMYNALDSSFTKIGTPPARENCPLCGSKPTVRNLEDSRTNLLSSVGTPNTYTPEPLPDGWSISCEEYQVIREGGTRHVLLDVRVQDQYNLCALPGSNNVPLEELMNQWGGGDNDTVYYCLCRRGVLSAAATRFLRTKRNLSHVYNITGGLDAWRDQVDSSFPKY